MERGQREGIIMNYDPELMIHLMSALNKGIFIHTNKENRFSIANIDPDVLHQMVINMLSPGLFRIAEREAVEIRS
jgi:hypothetical protein